MTYPPEPPEPVDEKECGCDDLTDCECGEWDADKHNDFLREIRDEYL